MKIGIVPTKHGYNAVVLPPYKGDWELYAPENFFSPGLFAQLRSQILQKLAEYAHEHRHWQKRLFVSLPWAAWSIASLALTSLWTMGLKYSVLYGWIRFFFFGDGIWALTQTLYQLPGLLRSKQIKDHAAKGKWKVVGKMPTRKILDSLSEREYIQRMSEIYPETKEFYAEMLRVDPPFVQAVFPLGISGLVKRLFLGPTIPKPSVIIDLGRMEETLPLIHMTPEDTNVVVYALPTGKETVLWAPTPRLAWGEIDHLGDEITVLSGSEEIDLEQVPALAHDNIYRPSVRQGYGMQWFWLGRLMLWGLIWIVGMDRPLEDLVGGLYLLIGLPLFGNLTRLAVRSHLITILEKFRALFYSPKVKLLYSERLAALEYLIEGRGVIYALQILDELGLNHLREFYRRVAWEKRWKISPPTGAGILKENE